jgi:hypothetical protein
LLAPDQKKGNGLGSLEGLIVANRMQAETMQAQRLLALAYLFVFPS